jgi:hypothetical protein
MSKRRKIVAVLGLLLAGSLLVSGTVVLAREPSLTRAWDEDVRVLSGVEVLANGVVRLTRVRDWRYTGDGVVAKDYFAGTYDPAHVEGLWLYEQELGLGGRIAHTFLVFEFPESYGSARWLGLSVETRREVGETYSLVGGVLRDFEVTHIWANEEDLVTRRVELLDYPLTRYRVSIPGESIEAILRQFVQETAELATDPRWYNTLTTNCTSSLIGYVNEVSPGAIPWHYSFVFTGRTDGYLASLGYLDVDSAQPVTREWLAEHPLR